MELELSVVILSWNTLDLTRRCLQTVAEEMARLGAGRVEVIVVDNASSDGSAEMVAQEFPAVHLIRSERNLGFAGGNNLAIEAARARQPRYIMLLNSDTEVCPGALGTMLDFMNARPDVAVVGSALLNPDGTLQQSCNPFPTLFREGWRLLHLDKLRPVALYPLRSWPRDRVREVDSVQGASMMVRREVMERVGLLDDAYFMYTEEVDWCRRFRDAGGRIYWVPQAEVIHYGGQSTRLVAARMFLELYRSKLQYFRKFEGMGSGRVYKLILSLASLLRLGLTPLALLGSGERRQTNLTLARRYVELLRALPGM